MARTFSEWYAAVDRVVEAVVGLGVDDLADGNSRDAFDAGASPKSYARQVLADNGFTF